MRLVGINPKGIKFLYNLRTNPEIDKFLTGNPPISFNEHMRFLSSNSDRFWVLEDGSVYVGYGQIKEEDEDTCEVGFVIDPKYQGRGYGKKIVDLICDKAKEKYKNILLEVKKDNLKAIHIYEKYGFTTYKTDPKILKMKLII